MYYIYNILMTAEIQFKSLKVFLHSDWGRMFLLKMTCLNSEFQLCFDR